MDTKILLSTAIILSILFSALPLKTVFAQNTLVDNPSLLKAKADSLLQETMDFKEHVGITAGIYADNQIMWTGSAGMRDYANNKPADEQMLTRTASISKSMTAVAIMQLVEQGKINLDTPIEEYVSEFPVKPQGSITVRQLLTHTSGVAHYKSKKDGFSLKQYSLVEAMDRFKDRDLVGTPGKVYQYTTYGYVVLGVIIQKVSGLPYEAYMKKYVWEPAGMHATSVENKAATYPKKSELYKLTDKGGVKKDYDTNLSIKVPGGGIQSTAGDLLRFGQALLNNTLIKKETFEQMIEDPQIKDKQRGTPYGMGWFLYAGADAENGRVIGHSGSQAGTSTQLFILLDKGVVVSCLSNTRGQWGKVHRMSRQLVNLAVSPEERAKSLTKIIPMSTTKLDRFLGKYRFGKDNVLTIKRKGNQLYSDLNQFKGLKLYPERDNKIFYRDTDAYFEFEMDAEGKIVKTTYSQDGELFYPEKIE